MSMKEASKIARVTKLLLDCKGWNRLDEVKAIVINSFGLTASEMAEVLKQAKA